MSVAAVVVTYNRWTELEKNLLSLHKQTYPIDRIYVVDNASTDGTCDHVKRMAEDNEKIVLCRLEKNVGGAGGFAFGLEKACQDQHDWIWLMDDDGRPENQDTLEKLMEVAEQQDNYAIVNCNVLCDGSELSFKIGTPYTTLEEQRANIAGGLIPDCACVFNGSLVGREVYQRVGNIRREYFIRGDEVEYLMRCKNNGVKVLTVIDSLYFHPKSKYTTLSFVGKNFDYEEMPIWKQFFLVRNYVATMKNTAQKHQREKLARGLQLIFLGIILHERSISRLGYAVIAVVDGYRGRFSNHFRGMR